MRNDGAARPITLTASFVDENGVLVTEDLVRRFVGHGEIVGFAGVLHGWPPKGIHLGDVQVDVE